MEHWIYVWSQIGSVFFWVLSIAGLFDALQNVRYFNKLLSTIMFCALSILFGYIAWWLWV